MTECGLRRGSTIGVGGRSEPAPRHPELVVVAGPLAPTRSPVRGTVLVGRGAACDLRLDHPSVAPAHALIERIGGSWRICPVTTARATTVDGLPVNVVIPLRPGAVIGIGAIDLQLLPPPPPPTTTGAPTATVHRAPPTWAARAPDPGPSPEAPPPEPAPRPPGVLTLLAPVAVGAILAVTVHPTAGLFTAATPLLAVGAHADARRRWRRDGRRADADHEAARGEHQRAVAAFARDQAADARRQYPSPVDAVTRARDGRELWPVRASAPDSSRIALGWADDDTRAPVTIALDHHEHLGIAGPPAWAEAVARGVLLSALTRRGPHDLGVAAMPGGIWSFLRWLPHLDGADAPLTIGPALTDADAGVVLEIADRPGALTDRCRAVVLWSPAGAQLTHPGSDRAVVEVRALVADLDLAETWARALARWTDPQPGGDLPDRVRLPILLGGDGDEGRTGRRCLRAPLGVGSDGAVAVDLVADGPHALVAGTTGAGKSELLRTWVSALAARHPPTAVAFVLLDYKGGSAFDACARLPHVAGVVTDLDAGLGERLLTSLRAEVRAREGLLRAARTGDLRDLDDGPARLVVVVDEFATLAAELPDFLGALVDVARRGRSLGVHLILATQRPAGAVNDDIRANTALRICLRTLDPADSQDVIGSPDAAALPARTPGRAWLRTGDGLRLLQVADSGARDEALTPVTVRTVGSPWPVTTGGTPTDLERLVDEAVAAWSGLPGPDPVWRPPLPDDLTLDLDPTGTLDPTDLVALDPTSTLDLEPSGILDRDPRDIVVLGRQDRPHDRSQPPLGWNPAAGHLVVLGGRGRGRTTTVRTALLGLAARRGPEDLHAYVLGRAGTLDDLADLPQVGTVANLTDRATVTRLFLRLEARLDGDTGPADRPATVIVLDGYESLAAPVDDLDGLRLLGRLDRLVRDGPGHRMVFALTSSRPSLQPPSLGATTDRLVVLGLDDPADYGLLALRPPTGDRPPGRGHTAEGHELQIGRLRLTPSQVAARHRPARAGRGPAPVTPLPPCVALGALTGRPARATVGLRDRDLGVATVDLLEASPFVVAGPPRSGRSAALSLLRDQGGQRPCTHHRPGEDPDRLRRAVADWLARPVPHLFVVDDAEQIDDPDGDLRALVSRRHPDALVLVAVRADAWREGYGSWLTALRPASHGLALRPDPVRDADVWVCALPPVGPTPPPGRGVLITDGTAEIVQVARAGG